MLAALGPTVLAACSSEDEGRSAVLITLDTVRADALGCYGGKTGVSPNLDRLAEESVLYEHAHTTAPITQPAHASMLTGLWPVRHTLRDNGLWPLPQEAYTLAEAARDAGVQTAAFVGAIVLESTFGLNQGFDVYDEPGRASRDQDVSFYTERSAAEVVDGALAWWERQRDRERPFFLWVHLFDAHAPYEPLPEFRHGPFFSDPYLGEIGAVDREVGRLLEALRADEAWEDTTVLVVADHGESLGEHQERSHSVYCYEGAMRVPFLLRRPDEARAGERSDENVSVVDVFPTLASAMGLAVPAGIDGVDLLGGRVAPDRGVYLESYSGWIAYGWSQIAGWLDARGKYLHSSQPELYDPRADAREERDLVRERADEVARYEAAIGAAAALPPLAASDDAIRAELVEKIQRLGYAGVGETAENLPHPLAPTERAAPQAMGEVYLACSDALAYFNDRAYAQAAVLLERVLEKDPGNPFALEFLSSALIRQGEHARALEPLRELLARGRQRASTYFRLGLCLRRTGARAEALEAFERSLNLAPDDPRVLLQLAEVCEELGRADAAAAYRARVP